MKTLPNKSPAPKPPRGRAQPALGFRSDLSDRSAPSNSSDYMNHPAFAKEIRQEREAAFRRGLLEPFRKRSLWIQLGLFAVVFCLWPVPVINPIKLLVVLFHEMSHVAAAYLTGGIVIGMAIDPGGAGVTLGIGGNEALILAAGYVGSLAVGCALYALSAVWKPVEVWLCLVAMSCASLFFGWLNDFTAVFGYGAVIILLIGLAVFPPGLKQFLLRVFATTSCLYPILDVMGEYLRAESTGFIVKGRVAGSDVAQLAEVFGLPKAAIAIAWGILGAMAVVWLVGWAAKKDAENCVQRSILDPIRRAREAYRNRMYTDPLYDPNDPSTVRVYRLK